MAKNPTPAQIAALKKSKGVKPTAAITKPGQKATGLAKSTVKDRFASTAKTPVKNAKSGFAGSGSSLGSSLGVSKITKGDVANAALSVSLIRTSGVAASGVGQASRYLGSKLGKTVTQSAFAANTAKGFKASGAGGKVKNVMTPMGKTLGSTRIGSAAQQSARMGNLEINELQKALRTGADISQKVVRGMNKTGKIVKRTSVVGIGGKAVVDKSKKK